MAASLRSFCCKRSIHLDIVHNKRIWNKLRFFCASNKVNSVRVRFAPSPTGWLHLGGLRTALYNYLFAKSRNGSFLLRIEDTDRSRFVPATTDHIQEILDWAGIIPDEVTCSELKSVGYLKHHQIKEGTFGLQERVQIKEGIMGRTCRRLELMRKEATRRGEASKYDNRCRHLSPEQMQEFLDKNTPFVIRLKLEPTPEPWNDLIKGEVSHDIYGIEGDPVLLKSDGYPTYHFANVVDDHFMGITHVLRGSEWISSTPKHILLYKAFGWTPPSFGHLPLIVNPDGTKLSKRQGDVNVQQIRDSDHFPESLLSYVTSIGGGFAGSTQGMSLKDMCQSFDISSVRKHTGRLDPTRLKEAAIANLHTKAHSDDPEVIKSLTDRLQGHINGAYKDSLSGGPLQEQVTNQDYLIDVIRWGLKDQRVTVLRDFLQPDLSCLWRTPSKSQVLELVTMETEAQSILKRCLQWIKDGEFDGDDLPLEELSAGLKSVMAQEKIKPKRFFQFLRKALTGDVQGPPVAEMISVLGKRNVILRLETALELVGQEQTA